MSFRTHPRRIWWRRAAFQIHLWAGVAVSLYIAAIGLSGSILVFKEELLPKPKAARSAPAAACSNSDLLSVMDRVRQARASATITMSLCPTDLTPFYATSIRDPEPLVVYSDPATGAPLGVYNVERSWVDWMERFHANLLSGARGRFWNGVGAAILAVLCITGLVVWWPGIAGWKRALVVDFHARWKRLNWDLHNAIGFWTLAMVLMWAVTGVYFTWPKPFEAAIERFSPLHTAKLLFPRVPPQSSRPDALDLRAILEKSRAVSPDSRLAGLFYGLGPGMPFTVYMARERVGDYTATDFVYFNPYTGAYLDTWRRGRHQSIGDRVYWLLAPLHFGTKWGLGVKVLWAALGLTFPVLAITGLLAYWNRYLSKRVSPGARALP